MGVKNLIKQTLMEKENRAYRRCLQRFQVTYGEWAAALEARQAVEPDASGSSESPGEPAMPEEQNMDAAECTAGIDIAEGTANIDIAESPVGIDTGSRSFVVISASEGCLSQGAMKKIDRFFRAHPEALVLYGDEDVWPKRGQEKTLCSEKTDGKKNGRENSGREISGRENLVRRNSGRENSGREIFDQENLGREKFDRENPGREGADERRSPWFKPDWSPDLLDNCLYFGSVVAVERELFDRVQKSCNGDSENWKTFVENEQEGIDLKAADWIAYGLWLYRCVVMAGAYLKGSRTIGHIPDILFHCNDEAEQLKFLEDMPSLQKCRNRYLRDFQDGWMIQESQDDRDNRKSRDDWNNRQSRDDRDNRKSRDNWYNRDGRDNWDDCDNLCEDAAMTAPVVSVIIPSKDQPDILRKCLKGCLATKDNLSANTILPLEIILVDNGSSPENRGLVEELVQELDASDFQIHYLYEPMDFHFSRMCNLGAGRAKGQFLLFLNDDVELCLPGCIARMAALADRSYTGAVGMKLLYPDSDRIQHVGITNLPMGPVHKMQFLNDSACYYYNANRGWRNVLAVTGACLMVDRDKFAEVGGFAEELRVAFNDVDLCFRLYELGYWNVCMNDQYAYHHESLSRGADESSEKLARLLEERDRLYRRHPALTGADPYYSIHLNRQGLDTRIRPAYVTAANRIQNVETIPGHFEPERWHRDDCLMLRIEDGRNDFISGYGVVLGDNNACYELLMLFKKNTGDRPEFQGVESLASDDEKGVTTDIYSVYLERQYRPDLEENMPDQVNVALSGFAVKLKGGILPAGNYQLGLAARNKVTGLRLVNWSNRIFRM